MMQGQIDTVGGEATAETNAAPRDESHDESRGPARFEPLRESLRRDVIADIARVAGMLERPLRGESRLSYRRYVDAGGHFAMGTIQQLGGWPLLCDAAGVRAAKAATAADAHPDTADDVVADIARIAREGVRPGVRLLTARGLPYHRYVEAGGRFTMHTISRFGGWSALCQAAGVQRLSSGGRRVRRLRQTTAASVQVEVASIDEHERSGEVPEPEQKTPPRGLLCMFGRKRRRGPGKTPQVRVTPETLEQQREVMADIHDVAHRAGLASPRLLTWETYCSHGGLYGYDQIAALGGFDILRRRLG